MTEIVAIFTISGTLRTSMLSSSSRFLATESTNYVASVRAAKALTD